MTLSNRSLRRSILCLLGIVGVMVCAVCAAPSGAQVITQSGDQFIGQLSPTFNGSGGSPVTSLLIGSLQGAPSPTVDLLYVDAPTTVLVNMIPTSEVIVGEKLNTQGSANGGFSDLKLDDIAFAGASSVVAALPIIGGYTNYAFAITGVPKNNLCLYYFNPQSTSNNNINSVPPYDGGINYPPDTGTPSECITLTPPPGGKPPNFTAIAPFPFKTGSSPQLLVEDSANDVVYVVAVSPTINIQFILHLTIG